MVELGKKSVVIPKGKYVMISGFSVTSQKHTVTVRHFGEEKPIVKLKTTNELLKKEMPSLYMMDAKPAKAVIFRSKGKLELTFEVNRKAGKHPAGVIGGKKIRVMHKGSTKSGGGCVMFCVEDGWGNEYNDAVVTLAWSVKED